MYMQQIKEKNENVEKKKDFLLKCANEIDKYLFNQKEKIVSNLSFCKSIFDKSERDYQVYNLKVIAFQIKQLIDGIEMGSFYNLPIDEKKIESIIDDFVKDIKRFIQEEKIQSLQGILGNVWSFGQTGFHSKAVFDIILIQCVDGTKIDSYDTIELYLKNLKQTSIRLAIELKVKEIIGFKSYLNHKGQEKFISISKIINFLKRDGKKWLDIPISLDELKSIYLWASNFVHNGKIIYEWQIHHSLYSLHDLFDVTKAKKFDIIQYLKDLCPESSGDNDQFYNNMTDFYLNKSACSNNISYFKKDKDICALEEAMNADKEIGQKNGKIKLDVGEFGWDTSNI